MAFNQFSRFSVFKVMNVFLQQLAEYGSSFLVVAFLLDSETGNMVRSKTNARKSTIPIEELDDVPTKRPAYGYNIFVADFIRGLRLGLGEGPRGFSGHVRKSEAYEQAGIVWLEDRPPTCHDWQAMYKKIYFDRKAARGELPRTRKRKKRDEVENWASIRARCTPKQLVDLNKALSHERRDALVKRNPFHNLLQLNCDWLNREFCVKLVERFNMKTRSLEFGDGRVCPIRKEDFERVLGIPSGSRRVPTRCEEKHRVAIDKLFGKENDEGFKDVFKGLSFAQLKKVILQQDSSDSQFQRAYMLFALGSFLCPTTKDAIGPVLFPAVTCAKMAKIKTYKWPAFILEWLVDQIRSFRDRASKKPRPLHGQSVGGCLFLLMIIYFDRFPMNVVSGEHSAEQGQIPIALWTKDLILKRIKMEPEDIPSKEVVLAAFPPHNMKNPAYIQQYHNYIYQFIENADNLRAMDVFFVG
ncbi:hypothetical protein Vadar_003685 [Vaccinium darrowii]|uniref:Uncharacterized protein n=1 Tax=Vaccinium darrowii TaxID=229202 RepID=A0ACB7XNC3_9ERIC|nr:hypothetical protein Vadar_003685 [Vaccinium darrowii]